MSAVDLKPVIDQVVIPIIDGTLAIVIPAVATAVVGWGAYLLQRFAHIKINDQVMARADALLQHALVVGQHKADAALDANSTIDVKNAVVAQAVAFAAPKLDPAMVALGYDPATLADRLLARIPVNTVPSVLLAPGAAPVPLVAAQPVVAVVPSPAIQTSGISPDLASSSFGISTSLAQPAP